MDSIEYADPQTINGLNLYAYCGNNPVINKDSQGTSWIKRIGNWFSNAGKAIVDFLSSNVGFSVQYGAEKEISSEYYGVVSHEDGVGYSKSFGNDKPVNFYVSAPTEWWNFWEYSVGVDVNINGWGAGLSTGTEASASLHLKNSSIDLFYNMVGRVGIKHAVSDDNGGYFYNQYTLNLPETTLAIAASYVLTTSAATAAAAISAGVIALLLFIK